MDIIIKSIYKIFENTLNLNIKKSDIDITKGYFVAISLDTRSNDLVVFVFTKELLVAVALVLLGEDKPSDKVIEDISKELANIIVGDAKATSSDMGYSGILGIPEFLGVHSVGDFASKNSEIILDQKAIISFEIEGARFSIYVPNQFVKAAKNGINIR